MSEITERAARCIEHGFAANKTELIEGLLTEIAQLRADLKTVSVAILEAHKENCILYGDRRACVCDNAEVFRFCHARNSSDYHGCRHYKPCECEACKIAGEAAA